MNDQPNAQAEQPASPRRVEARAAKDPVVRQFIFAAMLLAFGGWFLYDGYIAGKYPRPAGPFGEAINEYATWAVNAFGPLLLIPLGLLFLVKAVLLAKSVLIADDEGLGYAGKTRIAWGRIKEADASRLKSKGLLDLHHPGGKLTLDSWKLGDENFREIVKLVERHVPADKITR